MPRIAFAGSKTTTLECMRQLLHDGFSIDLLVTLTPDQGASAKVAGYMDLRPFAAAHGIRVYHPQSYALDRPSDREGLTAEQVDVLLVIGWQRLIPQWWLEVLGIGAFGMHGSPEPLPRGRGRSPMNWALLHGKTSFLTHLIKYDTGVDSGSIVGVEKFDITLWDDADTLHMKNRMAMNRLLRMHLPAIFDGTARYCPQPTDIAPTYFPKRTAEDGRIDWPSMDMMSLYNHIRCQTRPFPGAFTYLQGSEERFYFWRGHPFDSHIRSSARPGDIVETFHDGSFLVAVWDGTVRIWDYTSPNGAAPQGGQRFA